MIFEGLIMLVLKYSFGKTTRWSQFDTLILLRSKQIWALKWFWSLVTCNIGILMSRIFVLILLYIRYNVPIIGREKVKPVLAKLIRIPFELCSVKIKIDLKNQVSYCSNDVLFCNRNNDLCFAIVVIFRTLNETSITELFSEMVY